MPLSTVNPESAPVADAQLLQRFNISGPRYTSYPTANQFTERFGQAQLLQAYKTRRQSQTQSGRPLSVYIHIPFCESLCYYCACNKIITRHKEYGDPYIDDLALELGMVADLLRSDSAAAAQNALPQISQLHLGGGTPTFLSDASLGRLIALLQQQLSFAPQAECSIEVDPRTVDAARLAHLRAIGFNRLSFGVQDFDAKVQQCVHRQQSTEQVFALVQASRELGFKSINIDLIYGLPHQNQQSFARTLEQLTALRPDRVALYAYAHLPARFKPQRRIDDRELPGPAEKTALQALALQVMRTAGYAYIGMDHFALPEDNLAIARKQGLLHRNFQGYSTQPDADLVGLGVSSISKISTTYSQNAKDLQAWREALARGQLPVERGVQLTEDDLLRRHVIMALMCQGRIDFEKTGQEFGVHFTDYFADELVRLQTYARDALVVLEPRSLQVTPMGWTFVRAIAMVFDHYLSAGEHGRGFSRIL